MNLLRTRMIELESVAALVYRYKCEGSGCGLVITDICTGDIALRRLIYTHCDTAFFGNKDDKYAAEVWDEALEKTRGCAYVCAHIINEEAFKKCESEAITSDTADVAENKEMYKAVTAFYTNKKTGKFCRKLMNKACIQLASSHDGVKAMVNNNASVTDIVNFIVGTKVARIMNLPKGKEVDPAELAGLIGALNDMHETSAFKELRKHVKRMARKR